MAFIDLQNRVSANLIDVPASIASTIPTLVNAVIQIAEGLNNFNCMKAIIQGVLTTPSNHFLIQTPQGFKEPRGVPYWLDASNQFNWFDWAPNRTYVFSQWNQDNLSIVGPPAMLLLSNTVSTSSSGVVTLSSAMLDSLPIHVFPYSDGLGPTGGQYPITIPYWAYLPTLVNTTDINWFTTNMTEFIVAEASKMAFEMSWDEGAESGGTQQTAPGGRAAYWHAQAFGSKWDGMDLKTAGGWFKVGLELDKKLGYSPLRGGI